MGVLRVFHKYFKGASRLFHECLQKDLKVSVLCFKGVLGCFLSKKGDFSVQKSCQLLMQTQKHPKDSLATPVTYSRIT